MAKAKEGIEIRVSSSEKEDAGFRTRSQNGNKAVRIHVKGSINPTKKKYVL